MPHNQTRTKRYFSSPFLEFGEFCCRQSDAERGRSSVADRCIVVFPKSCGLVRQEGREPLVGSPNVSIFYNGGTPYTCHAFESGWESTNYLELDAELAAQAVQPFDPGVRDREEVFTFGRAALPPTAHTLQLALARCAERGVADAMQCEEILAEVLRLLLEAGFADAGRAAPVPAESPSRQSDYARWTEEVIARTFREPLSVTDVGRRVGVSTFYLCRLFKLATGTTMHAFRTRLRVRHAMVALADTRDSIARIALDTGFCSQSHMTNTFRQELGISPGELRRRLSQSRDARRVLPR